jgi:hypothetical protein
MDAEMQRRLRWVELFLKIKNYGVVCLRCGTTHVTQMVRQFQENGVDGLRAASKRPKSSPAAKVAGKHRDWIRELRNRGLGSRRIQDELKRFYNFEISRLPSTRHFEPWRRNHCFAGPGLASTAPDTRS